MLKSTQFSRTRRTVVAMLREPDDNYLVDVLRQRFDYFQVERFRFHVLFKISHSSIRPLHRRNVLHRVAVGPQVRRVVLVRDVPEPEVHHRGRAAGQPLQGLSPFLDDLRQGGVVVRRVGAPQVFHCARDTEESGRNGYPVSPIVCA